MFNQIERALVFVDEKGKSIGEGFVEFTRKNNALAAHKFCNDKCYFITSELRPVITDMADMYECKIFILFSHYAPLIPQFIEHHLSPTFLRSSVTISHAALLSLLH